MLLTPTDPPTLPFGVWEQHQAWMIPTLISKQTNVAYTHLISADPTVRRVRTTPILNDTNFNFEANQCCLHPSDMKTWKYNNLTNLTGMIWHIDPATNILERTKFSKLAFRIAASFKSRKWPICLPEGSKGSIGGPARVVTCHYILTP